MGRIEQVEVQSYTEWSSAIFVDNDGEEYDITLYKTYTHNMGFEEKDVSSVEQFGASVPECNPVWREIRKAVQRGGAGKTNKQHQQPP